MPPFVQSLGALIPSVLAILGGDFNDVLKFAHDRRMLQAAMAMAMTRPLPVWRVPVSFADTEDEVDGDEREAKPWGTAFRRLAESNSACNAHLANLLHRQLRERHYGTSGSIQMLLVLLLYIGGGAAIVCVSRHEPQDPTTRWAIGALAAQMTTGIFGVMDRSTTDSEGARKERSKLFWSRLRQHQRPSAFWGKSKLSEDAAAEQQGNYFDDKGRPREPKNRRDHLLTVIDVKATVGSIVLNTKLKIETMDHPGDFKIMTKERTGDNHRQSSAVQLPHRRSVLNFQIGHPIWEGLRWMRLDWLSFFAQTYCWHQLVENNSDLVLLTAIAQVSIAFIASWIIFQAILGKRRAHDRLLAAIHVHDAVLPVRTFDFHHDFASKAWNALVHFCTTVEKLRADPQGAIPWVKKEDFDAAKRLYEDTMQVKQTGNEAEKDELKGELHQISRAERAFSEQVKDWMDKMDVGDPVNQDGKESLIPEGKGFDLNNRTDTSMSSSIHMETHTGTSQKRTPHAQRATGDIGLGGS